MHRPDQPAGTTTIGDDPAPPTLTGPPTSVLVAVDDGTGVIEVHVVGRGPVVVLVPSVGRGATDFDDLARRLDAAGYCAVMPEPRGIGGSTASIGSLTMHLLADDTATVIRSVSPTGRAAAIVGHAFGQRIARLTAARHPTVVDGVVTLAAGGRVEPDPQASAALLRAFDADQTEQRRLAAIRTAFFSPGNDPAAWRDGWNPLVAFLQGEAKNTVETTDWWIAGSCDVLVVQPADDVIAPRINAELLVDDLGDRAELVVVDDAGHALLPEQPELVAAAIIDWLDRRR